MAFTRSNTKTNYISELMDLPNDQQGLTAAQLKAKFDQAGTDLKDWINNVLLPALESIVDGSSGADNIGATAITDLDGTTVQAILESLRNKLRSTTAGVSGADFVKSSGIAGLTGDNVQALLNALKSYVDTHKISTDHDVRYYTKTEMNANLTDLAGAGRTTETVKGNADAIASLNNTVSINETDIENKVANLAGTGRTTETVKGTYDDLQAHKSNITNPHNVTASQVGAYSKTEMQTSGQAQLHWDNITNKPAMADKHWKPPVATVNDLPLSGNTDGDLRIVLNTDTVYTWDAATNTWKVIGASGNGISDHGALIGLADDDHLQYLRTDGTRKLTGNLDINFNQIKNVKIHPSPTAPSPAYVGMLWYDTANDKLKVMKATGWTDVSGQGALIKDKKITATAGQTVLDISDTGQYQPGTNAMNVYKKNASGRYELLPESAYTEANSTTVTLATGATAGDEYYLKWFENSPSVLNAIQEVLDEATYSVETAREGGIFSFDASTAENSPVNVTVQGKTVTNLMGTDGDCESTSPFTATNCTLEFNTTNKVFGSKAIKLTLAAGQIQGSMDYNIYPKLDKSKYYLISAYLRKGTATNLKLRLETDDIDVESADVTATTMIRTGIVIQPSDIDTATTAVIQIQINGTETQNGYVDGIMVNEITAAEYALDAAECMNRYPWHTGTKSAASGLVRRVGKNLFDIRPYSNQYVTQIANGYRIAGSYANAFANKLKLKPNTTYTTSCIVSIISGTGSGSYGRIALYDGSTFLYLNTGAAVGYKTSTFTTPSNIEMYKALYIYGSSTADDIIEIINIQIEEGTTATAYEPYDEQNGYYSGTLNDLSNGTRDEINISAGTKTTRTGEDNDISGTDYDTLDTTTYTNVDVVKTTTFSLAAAGTTAKDGMTRYYNKDGVELSEVAQADIDNTASVGKYYWHTDKTLWIIVAKGAYADIAAARTGLGTTRLIYQLATPVLSYPRAQQLSASPGDTMMWLNLVEDYGFYNNGLTITNTTIPIKALTQVIKFDKQTGAETNIDIATCTVAGNGLSFTSTALVNDDLVWFEYEYDSALSIVPTIVESHAVNLIANVKSLNDSVGRLDDKVDKVAWQMQTQINEVNDDVDTHIATTNPHSATSEATANRLVLRDASGRAKVAAPSAADDIARKDTVDNAISTINANIDSIKIRLYMEV